MRMNMHEHVTLTGMGILLSSLPMQFFMIVHKLML